MENLHIKHSDAAACCPQVTDFVDAHLEQGAPLEAIAKGLCNECNKPHKTAMDNVSVIISCFKGVVAK